MTRIKICGTRRMADVEVYNTLGVDYAGFIFAKSPRRVSADEAKAMIAQLDGVCPVGVFVNASAEEICRTAELCRLRVIQLHGDEDADFAKLIKSRTGLEIWRAVRIKDKSPAQLIASYPADRFLLDTYCKGYGGSGKSFDWSLTAGLDMSKIILAGGLSADNAAEAAALGAYALDLNSGVETDGYKDKNKLAAAVEKIRAANEAFGKD